MCKPTDHETAVENELQDKTIDNPDQNPSIDDQITSMLVDEIMDDPMIQPIPLSEPGGALREAMGLMAIVYTLFDFKETDDIETEIRNNEHFAAAHVALHQMMTRNEALADKLD